MFIIDVLLKTNLPWFLARFRVLRGSARDDVKPVAHGEFNVFWTTIPCTCMYALDNVMIKERCRMKATDLMS